MKPVIINVAAAVGVAAIVAFGSLSLGSAAEGKKLPCGDYDGVPSHNDCAPVGKKKASKCQKWIDKGNATNDAKQKEMFKQKYISCVG
jgi:hypothetical protein